MLRALLLLSLAGCLVTEVNGDPDPDLGFNGLMIRTTCTAQIKCAPPLVFDWCAPLQRHSWDADDYVWAHWFESGCTDTDVGWIGCDAGGVPCTRRGLVEPK